MMAGSQTSDWYQAWPVGWSESQDMVESILGQTGRVSGRFTASFNSLTRVYLFPCFKLLLLLLCTF